MKTKNKHSQDVSLEDVKMAIKKLDVLGTGFTLIGKQTHDLIVQSVPSELSMDHTSILEIAQKVSRSPSNSSFLIHANKTCCC